MLQGEASCWTGLVELHCSLHVLSFPSEEMEDFKQGEKVIKWKISKITLKSYVACSFTQVFLTLKIKTTG